MTKLLRSMLLAGLLLLAPAYGFAEGNKVPRTADDVHVPEPSTYGVQNVGSAGHRVTYGVSSQLFPPGARLYRAQLARKSAAHYADGLAAEGVECENPWSPIVSAIEGIKRQIEEELRRINEQISQYERERDEARAEADTINKQKGYISHYTSADDEAREKSTWVVGLKEVKERWENDLKQVEDNLRDARAHNAAWKKPAKCDGEETKGGIQVGGGGTPADSDDEASVRYPHKSTVCEPCQALVNRYNQNMDAARTAARRIGQLQGEIQSISNKPSPNGMSLDEEIRYKASETRTLRRELEQLEKDQAARQGSADDLARQIADCEKRCATEEEGKKKDGEVKVGGGGVGGRRMGTRYQPLRTSCKPCESMVSQYNAYITSLNSLDPDIEDYERLVRGGGPDVEKNRYTLSGLGKQEESLLRAKNELAKKIEACEFKCKAPTKWPYVSSKCRHCADAVRSYNEYVDKLFEAEKEADDANIRLYKERLSQGHHTLMRCEQRCNAAEENGKHILVPGGSSSSSGGGSSSSGGIEIELEDAHAQDGTNAFDAKEVEHIRDGGHETMTPPPSQPPIQTTPPIRSEPVPPVEPVKPPEVKVGGGESIIIPPPPKQPFDAMLASNSGSLRHTMGKSSCPDALGRTSVRSSDNRPIRVEIIGNNSVIAGTVSGSGTASPGIEVTFTCAVPGGGSYSETLNIKATDPASGESRTLSYSASITVSE